jgi:hypothetical protein
MPRDLNAAARVPGPTRDLDRRAFKEAPGQARGG